MKILYVDDEKILANLIGRWIEQMGHDFLTAENVSQAIEIVQNNEIDVVVTDYDLQSRVWGTDLFFMIRELGYSMPVILVSGTPELQKDPKINPEIWSLLSNFLEKPFSKEEFQAAIKAAVDSIE